MEHQSKICTRLILSSSLCHSLLIEPVLVEQVTIHIYRVIGIIFLLGLLAAPRAHALSLAPDFTLSDINGELFSLSDFRGTIVLLEFMASWCSTCQSQVPHLQTVQSEFGSQLTILSIGIVDTDDALQQFQETHSSDWIYARDTLNLPATYGVTGIPTLYIIDQDGYIRSEYHMTTVDATVLRDEIHLLLTYTLTLTTIPTFDNVHFQIDNRDYRTVNGSINVELEAGLHHVTLSDTMITRHGSEYQFVNWSALSGGSDPSIQLNVTADVLLAANYVRPNNTTPLPPETPLQYSFPLHLSDVTTQLVVQSCCQVSAFQYLEADHTIAFQVDDTPEATGFVNVTIPLDVLREDYTLHIDSVQVTSVESQNDTHTFIYITYPHGNHTIELILANDVRSDPNSNPSRTEILYVLIGLCGVLTILGLKYKRLLGRRILSFTNHHLFTSIMIGSPTGSSFFNTFFLGNKGRSYNTSLMKDQYGCYDRLIELYTK